jgi:hypothetical protein
MGNAQGPQHAGLGTRYGRDGERDRLLNSTTPRSGPNMLHKTFPGGTVLVPNIAPAGRTLFPWSLRPGDSAAQRIVTPGTFSLAVMPVISGVRLDNNPPPQLTITPSVINYVYLEIQVDYDIQEGFIAGGDVLQGAVEVIASTSVAVDVPGSGIFYVLLGTISAVGVYTQMRFASMDFALSDTGTGDTEGQLTIFT